MHSCSSQTCQLQAWDLGSHHKLIISRLLTLMLLLLDAEAPPNAEVTLRVSVAVMIRCAAALGLDYLT
jgi:hypothetical protein